MAESAWKVRVLLFVRAVDNTPENRQSFGAIFANNGSGETVEDESRLLDNVIRLSTSGTVPAQVFGLETAVLLPDMRDDLRTFLEALPQARYYMVANIHLAQYDTGEFIESNKVGFTWPGVFTMADALSDLEAERGLLVIGE